MEEFDAQKLTPENTIIVLNKCDIKTTLSKDIAREYSKYTSVQVSCLNRTGAEQLKQEISKLIDTHHITASADDILVSARHAQSLQSAVEFCTSAKNGAEKNLPAELIASDLYCALNSLGDIVGKTDNEAILDRIFSKFCIGK